MKFGGAATGIIGGMQTGRLDGARFSRLTGFVDLRYEIRSRISRCKSCRGCNRRYSLYHHATVDAHGDLWGTDARDRSLRP